MKNKIFIKDWLHNKPYSKETSVDIEYLSVANKVYREFLSYNYIFDEIGVDDDEVVGLSVFLTCYLEDLVSDTNFWNTFVKIHQSKYNKEIPFFSEDNYIVGEVNLVDIQFLIWYALNMLNRERFLSPYDSYLTVLSKLVFEILDYEFDYVEGNSILKQHYDLKTNADFYETRGVLQKILFDSYLLGIDSKKILNEKIEDVIEESENSDQNEIMRIINSVTDLHTHSYRTKLLALKGKEWFAEIIGNEHPLFEPILNISEKVSSYFLYKGQNQNYFHFQHVATDTMFDLTKESFEVKIPLDDRHIYYIEMVLWNKEWTFSGICFLSDFDADIILDEKNNVLSINKVFQLDENYLSESIDVIKNQEKTFCEKFGSNVLFLNNSEVQPTLTKFTEAHNNNLIKNINNKEAELAEAKQRQKNKGYLKTDSDTFEIDSDENVLLFFNPNSGIEMYNDICGVFPDDKNPFYSGENKFDIKMFLFSPVYPKELSEYLIDHYASKLDFFKNDIGKKYILDFDFLQRFWRNENYFNKPSVTIL